MRSRISPTIIPTKIVIIPVVVSTYLGLFCSLYPVKPVFSSSDDVLLGSPLADPVENLPFYPGNVGIPSYLLLVADPFHGIFDEVYIVIDSLGTIYLAEFIPVFPQFIGIEPYL